jgi:hypothetical protein
LDSTVENSNYQNIIVDIAFYWSQLKFSTGSCTRNELLKTYQEVGRKLLPLCSSKERKQTMGSFSPPAAHILRSIVANTVVVPVFTVRAPFWGAYSVPA